MRTAAAIAVLILGMAALFHFPYALDALERFGAEPTIVTAVAIAALLLAARWIKGRR